MRLAFVYLFIRWFQASPPFVRKILSIILGFITLYILVLGVTR